MNIPYQALALLPMANTFFTKTKRKKKELKKQYIYLLLLLLVVHEDNEKEDITMTHSGNRA
jgi:hypothetical protein